MKYTIEEIKYMTNTLSRFFNDLYGDDYKDDKKHVFSLEEGMEKLKAFAEDFNK